MLNEALPPMIPEVMAEPETFPAVDIVASLLSAIAAVAEISASVIVASEMVPPTPPDTADAVAKDPKPCPVIEVTAPESLDVAIAAVVAISALTIVSSVMVPPMPPDTADAVASVLRPRVVRCAAASASSSRALPAVVRVYVAQVSAPVRATPPVVASASTAAKSLLRPSVMLPAEVTGPPVTVIPAAGAVMPTLVTLPIAADTQPRLPPPSVFSTCPDVPSTPGSTQTLLTAIVSGAFNPT